jgi:hypothetical protein
VVYKGVIYSRDVCSTIFYLINRNRFGLRLPSPREKKCPVSSIESNRSFTRRTETTATSVLEITPE